MPKAKPKPLFAKLKFVRKLPPKASPFAAGSRFRWRHVLAALSRRPGRWAQIGSGADYRNAAVVIARHRKQKLGRYQLALRATKLFARRVR